MERLQLALEQARQKRGTTSGQSVKQSRTASNTQASDTAADLSAWAELKDLRVPQTRLKRKRVLAFDADAQSTHFDVLRTKIMQMASQNHWSRVAITSPNSFCGKTTTCLNLAYSMARNSEVRVLLIEMDMRRPALAKVLGLTDKNAQFSRVLEGKAKPEEHLFRLKDNFAIGFNTSRVAAPAELLQSEVMRTCLDDLEAAYKPTLMLFDMPPMMVSDDVLGFSNSIDAAILIAAAESTTIPQVDTCERELSERTNVMGVILNKCRYMEKQHEYNYY